MQLKFMDNKGEITGFILEVENSEEEQFLSKYFLKINNQRNILFRGIECNHDLVKTMIFQFKEKDYEDEETKWY